MSGPETTAARLERIERRLERIEAALDKVAEVENAQAGAVATLVRHLIEMRNDHAGDMGTIAEVVRVAYGMPGGRPRRAEVRHLRLVDGARDVR